MLNFRPRFDQRVSGWAANHAKKNLWKFYGLIDLEDLIQEAWLVFHECRLKSTFDNPKHFMAYFKVAYFHHCTDLVYEVTRSKKVGNGVSIPLPELVESSDVELETAKLLSHFPNKLDKVVKTVLDDEEGFIRNSQGNRETTNEYISRLAGGVYADYRQIIGKALAETLKGS